VSAGSKDASIRKLSASKSMQPLLLEPLGSAIGDQPLVVPHHGVISRDRLRALYVEELTDLYEEARQQGLEEGREQGRRDALLAAERDAEQSQHRADALTTELQQQLESLDRVIAGLDAERLSVLAAAEVEIVALAYGCLTKVVGNMAGTPEFIAGQVRAALEAMPEQAPVRVHLSQSDHAAIVASGAAAALAQSRSLIFAEDERMSIGQCRLESAQGSLDASLEVQLEELRRLLVSTHRRRNESDANQPA
jgi:flagellar assembly protein FliH